MATFQQFSQIQVANTTQIWTYGTIDVPVLAPTDLVIVLLQMPAGGGRQYSVSGLGTTWTSFYSDAPIYTGARNIYSTTGATGPGTVTIGSIGDLVTASLWVISGLAQAKIEQMYLAATEARYANGVSWDIGRATTVRPGQAMLSLVLGRHSYGSVFTVPASGTAPSTGWAVDAPDFPAGFGVVALHHDGVDTTTPVLAQASYTTGSGTNDFVDTISLLLGSPAEERVVSSYLETLTRRNPALALNTQYLEALTRRNPALALNTQYVEVMSQAVTAITAQQVYLEYMTGPPVVAPTELYMHGWGLVIPGA